MIDSPTHSEYEQLSVTEKILHVQDLWDRIAERPEQVEVTEEQRQELDRRLADHVADPEEGSTWEQARERIQEPR